MNKTKWTLKIADSFCEYQYIIEGTPDVSIYDIAIAVEQFINGRIIEEKFMPRED